MIRRLKHDIVDDDGAPRFHARRTRAIAVHYPDDEREGTSLLESSPRACRRKRAHRPGAGERPGHPAAQEAHVLLPARVRADLQAHKQTLDRATSTVAELPDYLLEAMDWDDDLVDDETGPQAELELPPRDR